MGAVNEFVKIVQATFDLEVFIFENLAVLKSPISQSLNVACAGINKSTVSIIFNSSSITQKAVSMPCFGA